MSGSLPCRERREGYSKKRKNIWENTQFERVAYSENGEKFLMAETWEACGRWEEIRVAGFMEGKIGEALIMMNVVLPEDI